MIKLQKKKKGFTLTELAIVIAVIAILVAVLVPTFVSLINKANESADKQTANNLNTALSVYEAENGKPSDVDEAREALAAAGYSSILEPTTSGYYYYWNSEYNIVMLVDVSDSTWQLVYSASANAETALANSKANCYNLNSNGTSMYQDAIVAIAQNNGNIYIGQTTTASTADTNTKNTAKKAIKADDSTTTTTSYSMTDYTYAYEDFVAAANITKETFKGATVYLKENITIADGDTIDPVYNFQGTFEGNNYTITIAAGGITPVYKNDSNNGYMYDNIKKYGYGLFASVTNGGIIQNLTVAYNDTVTDAEQNTTLSATDPENVYTYFGGITGFLSDSTISGCTVTGSIVQYNRVGGIVGTSFSGNITNCTVEANITALVSSSNTSDYCDAGGIVAYVNSETSDNSTLNISGCIVGSNSNGITITAKYYAGGIAARITTGTEKVNLTSYTDGNTTIATTVQNVTVAIDKDENKSSVGAVCGYLAIHGGLRGSATIKNVEVTGHAETGGGRLVYIDTSTETETYSIMVSETDAQLKGDDGNWLKSNYFIIIGSYQGPNFSSISSDDGTGSDDYGTFKDETANCGVYTYNSELFNIVYKTSESED